MNTQLTGAATERRFSAVLSMRFELDVPESAVDADGEPDYSVIRQRLFEAVLPLTLSTDIDFEIISVDDVLALT